jgi:outer membrane immunogenic protein
VFMGLCSLGFAPHAAQAQSRWSGAYAGINGGYGQFEFQRSNVWMETRGTVFGLGPSLPVTRYPGADSQPTIERPFGGAQFGFAWQSGALVAGLETDIQAGDLRQDEVVVATADGPTYRGYTRADYFGTVRARVGYDVGGWLVYGTGGMAYAQAASQISVTAGTPSSPIPGGPYSGEAASMHIGFAVGGGVEIPLTPALSLKAEYLHLDFASRPYRMDLSQSDGSSLSMDRAMTFDIVRAGLNVRF